MPVRQRSSWRRAFESHEAVEHVHYPGLPSHPDFDLASRVLTDGFGAIVTIDLGTRERAQTFIRNLSEIPFAPSLGDVQTTLSHPTSTSHRGQSAEQLARQGISAGMVRISVGIEDPDDLWREFRGAWTLCEDAIAPRHVSVSASGAPPVRREGRV